jgi:DNA-binding response OmpR family regulator
MSANNILVLTDDLIFIDKLKNIFDPRYYNLNIMSKLDAPEQTLSEITPDLIMIDILSRSFNPIATIEKIKENPLYLNKLIIVSQNKKIENIVGPSPKVKGYISKPVDFEALKKIISENIDTKNKKVIAIDDDSEFLDLIRIFLENMNLKVITLNDSRKAINLINSENPSLILLDIMMPHIDGFEIMQRLQEYKKTADIPILILTALKFDKFQEKGMLTGLPEMIYKEIDDKVLLDFLEQRIINSKIDNNIPVIKPKILLADDQTDLLLLIKEKIENSGFQVYIANDGDEAIKQVYENNPDIIILDYNMPMKNGLEVAQILKDNPLFAHIPIVILTSYSEKQAKLQGLSMGIDDYLIKPIDTDELIARIRMILKRNKQVLDTNPLSKLPGNPSIQARIEKAISEKKKFAVMYLDLNNFKAYNDVYGFEAGDRIIKTTANILVKTVMPNENSDDFIGHIGGDDFIVITSFDKAESMAAKIIKNFDEIVPSFYKKEDLEKGYIVSSDRQGNILKFPLLGISIAIVHNFYKELNSYAQISSLGSELKKAAKLNDKSSYAIDKRKS